MTQTPTLSDVLLKGSALINSLVSQACTSFGPGAGDNSLFSSLVSADLSQGSSTGQGRAISSSSFSSSTDVGASSQPLSTSQILKGIADLRSSLHQALAMLHRQQSHASSTKGDGAGAKTSQAPQTSARPDSATRADTAQVNTTASTQASDAGAVADNQLDDTTAPRDPAAAAFEAASIDDAQNKDDAESKALLANVLIELLALIQVVIQGLMQAKPTSGGMSAEDAASALDLLTASSSGTADLSGDLLAETDATTSTAPVPDYALSGPATPILEVLKSLEKNAQKLLAEASGDRTDVVFPEPQDSGTSASTLSIADAVTQLAQLEARIKDVASALQQQRQNARANAMDDRPSQAAAQLPSALLAKTAAQTEVSATNAPALAMTQAQAATVAAPTVSEAETTASSSSPGVAAAATLALNGFDDAQTDADLMSGGGKSFSFGDGNASLRSGLSSEGTQASGTYTFASTLSAFRAANGGNVGLPSVVDQVVLQMHRSVKSGQSQISVQLQPGDLGKITIKLDFDREGKVQGSVTAENPKTLEMLQKDSRSLERALQDAGLRADPGSLHFSLGGQGNQKNANEGDQAVFGSVRGTLSASDSSEAQLDIGAMAETYYLTPTGVNIRV